jgi:hypothetical protein
MVKKKKEETLADIIDRIEEDLISLRDKADELEDQDNYDDYSDDEEEDKQ